MINMFVLGIPSLVTPMIMLLIFIGVVIGIIFGSIPGLSATMAIALFLPVTYGLDPMGALSLLVSLYIGGVSGGLISAILLHIPGTPSSVATCFDGYPMTQHGQAMKALGVGIFFSFLGTLVSVLALAMIAPTLANLAIQMGDAEYFAICLFALTMIASLASESIVAGLLAGVFGMICATIGMAPIDAAERFTFGSVNLSAGVDILPVLIGVFALTEILVTAETNRTSGKAQIMEISTKGVRGFGFSVQEFIGQIPNAVRSALIGLGIGILPGLGGSTANLVAYTVAQNQSKYPEKFGTGIIDGVVATETSNNASIGGAMVPLLALGIPGDMATAMLLGGLMIQGLQPGPLLFKNQPSLVYGVFFAMFLANFVMLFVEYYGIRIFVKALKIPKYILLPVVFMLCIVGAYGLNNRIYDTFIVIAFGLFGYAFRKFKIPIAPFIMGFILGELLENYFRRALMSSQGSFSGFFTRPVSCIFIILAVLSVVLTVLKNLRKAAAPHADS